MPAPGPQNATPVADPRFPRLSAITSRLTQILTQEMAILEAGPVREIAQFQAEKSKLLGHYRTELMALRRAVDSPHAPDQRDLQALKRETEAFKRALRDHDHILVAKKTATEGILQAIGNEVARRNKPVESYQKNGILGPAMPAYAAAQPTTLTLDRWV